ncbi:AraC family transcriptional regulator [Aliivibrio fischeri]|uniref:AraC family transcriptional regulator n=1 Tax=Aliivibrio fischeri TaxID=668 RepID=UPI00084BC839|nr:AraC family transcriptional regulator [Aliivibrio fischeri]OED53752.1 hypothetical protein BEI47_17375 [Aliivibrio fischeri]
MIPFVHINNKNGASIRQGYEIIDFYQIPFNVFCVNSEQCEPHWHSAIEVILVIEGKYKVMIEGVPKSYGTGDVILIFQNQIHSLFSEVENSKLLTFQFSPNMISLNPNSEFVSSQKLFLSEKTDQMLIWSSALNLINSYIKGSNCISCLQLSLAYQFLHTIELFIEQSEVPHRVDSKNEINIIKKCIVFVDENYKENISLSDLTQLMDVSYSHLSRMFKRVSGYNFKDYLSLMRISKSIPLLCNTQLPIIEIALTCGFSEYKSFITSFKKIQNETPTSFKKNYKSGLKNSLIGSSNIAIPIDLELVMYIEKSIINRLEE